MNFNRNCISYILFLLVYSSKFCNVTEAVYTNPTTTAHAITADLSDNSFETIRQNIGNFNSSLNTWFLKYCEPEIFRHYYIGRGNHLKLVTNKWHRTKPGMNGTLEKVCLLPNGFPLTRRCLYADNVTFWEHIDNRTLIKCLGETQEPIITTQLNTLQTELETNSQSPRVRHEVVHNLRSLLKKPNKKIIPADIIITNEILQNVEEADADPALSQDVVGICSTMMATDEKVLRMSARADATNTFLRTFENSMDAFADKYVPSSACGTPLKTSIVSTPTTTGNNSQSSESVETISFSNQGVYAHLTADISVFFVNPKCSKISGIGIYDPKLVSTNAHLRSIKTTRQNFHFRFLYMDETLDDLVKEPGLEVAVFLPENLWNHVVKKSGQNKVYLILKVYSHDALFVDPDNVTTCKPSSKILAISISNFKDSFPTPLQFILRNKNFGKSKNKNGADVPGTGCGYWNYMLNSWVRDGVEAKYSNMLDDPVVVCNTNHLTQFSFLIGGSYRLNEFGDNVLITPLHQRVLDIISLVGCALSLMGLIGIWLTALISRSWRAQASTKVLLNMCVALTLQMVLFLFVNTDDISEQLVEGKTFGKCIAIGALLQYSILVLFTWMLIIAFLQFQRYVTVIGVSRPRHYILKAAIAAWGFPLIPTLLAAFIDPKSYIPTQQQLRSDTGVCYPSGYALTFGVVLPVTLICIANLAIFVHVFYSLSHTLNQSLQRSEKKMIITQIRLSILLFFLLGLSWIFGIFAFMGAGIVFSYLFCLTATFQGLVLFVYFVLLDELPRKSWAKFLHISKSTKIERKELQSITTSTGVQSDSGRQ